MAWLHYSTAAGSPGAEHSLMYIALAQSKREVGSSQAKEARGLQLLPAGLPDVLQCKAC
jgi:hypothetical protein